MARSVNTWITNWRKTGSDIYVPQYAVDITVRWVDNDGQPREHIETVLFPNILSDVPVSWVKQELTDLMLRALRTKAGVDSVVAAGVPLFPAIEGTDNWFVRNSSILQWLKRRRA